MNSDLISLNKSFGLDTPNKLINKTQYALQREGSEIIKEVVLANIHEQGRALLTKTALDNLGALSALEEYLCKTAPSGQERYRHIVDSYTFGAAQKIRRW